MKVILLGVRGSTQAPGRDFVRYGGHTSCVAVARDDEPPTLVLDAGTGVRSLGRHTDGRAFTGSVLLGHLHWDHTTGLPFSPALDTPDSRVDVYLPDQDDGQQAVDVLRRAMSPPHFPIEPAGLRGAWSFRSLPAGRHVIDGFDVLAREIPHKGGRTFGYRVSDGSSTLAYLSDHWPVALGDGPEGFGEYHDAALELCAGADLVLHDAQYTPEEFPARRHFGHSTIDYAIRLGEKAGAREVLLFHHDPNRTDDELDALVARYGVAAAEENAVIQI